MQTTVLKLFVHGERGTRPEDASPVPMLPVPEVEAVEGKGLREDRRYFRPPADGRERKRQVSLIDEGTIRRLEQQFGPVPLEFVKAQIVLAGELHLPSLVGSTLRFPSGAELLISIERVPCYAMDLIHQGLREAMTGGQQGALATVQTGGRIVPGDAVTIHSMELTAVS